MDNRINNLNLYCANQDIEIDGGTRVQGGAQYTLNKRGIIVYVTLYDSGTCFARGANSRLLNLLRVWCDYSFLDDSLHPDFASSWREWNTNANYIVSPQKVSI